MSFYMNYATNLQLDLVPLICERHSYLVLCLSKQMSENIQFSKLTLFFYFQINLQYTLHQKLCQIRELTK
jgi:hypothetical protein